MLGVHKARRFFTGREKEQLMEAIKEAEHQTSGEIRIHVESSTGGKDPIDRAKQVFEVLGMTRTELRNGVLIYLAVAERKFAIIGDRGIDAVVPANFWEDTKETMRQLFKESRFADGVCQGIISVGEHLKRNFPYQSGDVNELPDEISEGN